MAKLDASGAPPAFRGFLASIREKEACLQATHVGTSAGRARGPVGLAQGLSGSTVWSLLAQDPAWVLIAEELDRPGGAAEAYGIRAPPKGWSDDHIFAIAGESQLLALMAVFGAACVDP